MNIYTGLGISLAVGLAASGCTSLHSVLTIPPDKKAVSPGLTYRLPAKQYQLDASFELTSCAVNEATEKVDLKAKIQAAYTESLIGDVAYTVDYQKLNGWTKVTDAAFTLTDTGLLLGVNASQIDQSGKIISNTVSAVSNVSRGLALPISAVHANALSKIRTFSGSSTVGELSPAFRKEFESVLGAPLSASDKLEDIKKRIEPCERFNKAMAALTSAKTTLKAAQKQDEEIQGFSIMKVNAEKNIEQLKGLVEAYSTLGAEEKKARLLSEIEAEKKVVAGAETKLGVLGESQVDKARKAVETAQSKFLVKTTAQYIPRRGASSLTVKVSSALVVDLFEEGEKFKDKDIVMPSVTLDVSPLQAYSEEDHPLPKEIGLVYRVPAPATLMIYENNGGEKIELERKVVSVPQYGSLGSLDLDNRIFDDNVIEVAFSGLTGSPTTLSYRAKSKGESASASAKDATGIFLELNKSRREDQLTAAQQGIELESSRVALAKDVNSLSVSNADTAKNIMDAQIQRIRDQQRLEAVRTGTATALELELESLNTQEQVYVQRVKTLKAQNELRAQEAAVAAGLQ